MSIIFRASTRWTRLAFLACTGLACGTASATIVTVGGDVDCDYPSVQQAINALPAGGTHEVRIAASQTYTAQAISIVGRALTLKGGFAHCADASPTLGGTTLSGEGGSHDSVLTITGSGNNVILENLTLTKGDEVDDGYGGGIDFRGAGKLTLRQSTLIYNYAGYGGGIYFTATGGAAELDLDAGSLLYFNTAQLSGGGIRLEGAATLYMLEADSVIFGNKALGFNLESQTEQYGYGGGIELLAGSLAYIGSPGFGAGTIIDNSARYGGGLAIYTPDDSSSDAEVYLFSTNANQATRISGNSASHSGGGVYVGAFSGSGFLHEGFLCAHDFRIDGNSAQQGAAIYADSDEDAIGVDNGGNVVLNSEGGNCLRPTNFGAVVCAADTPCNTINDNLAQTTTGDPTTGAAILIQDSGNFHANRTSLRGNHGGQVLRFINDGDDSPEMVFSNSLIADNVLTGNVIKTEGDDADLRMENSTIAGNVVGSNTVLSVHGNFNLTHSILWQPGKTSLTQSGGSRLAEYVVTSERFSLDNDNTPFVVENDPRFEDPAHGDYHPIAASPAVDFGPSNGTFDLDGKPRDVELPIKPNYLGHSDLGAYERQQVFSMVRNRGFGTDLRQWAEITPGAATWNAAGFNSAGSVDIGVSPALANGAYLYGMTQCVHIPGPGTYELNGFGWGSGSLATGRDYVRLHWILRYAPTGESCFSQPADMQGDLAINNSNVIVGPPWGAPTAPATIVVPEAQWTTTTSVEILLVVREGGTNLQGRTSTSGHFDGITLEPVDTDLIFANGFDGP